MMAITKFLNEKLVREIQIIKTGFAICTTSAPVQEAIVSRMSDLQLFLSTKGACIEKKPKNHSAYLLSCIPRSYVGFNSTRIQKIEISVQKTSEALTNLTNVTPVSIIERRGSTTSQYSAQKDWVVLYPAGSALSKIIPLFGVRVHVKLLPKRTKIPQCGRCFSWHNEWACSRTPHCRLCGSTQHTESGYTSCNPDVSHNCPSGCVNCHGPHPADSLECLVRPRKDCKMLSRAEIAKIRHAASAAWMRLKITHCDAVSKNKTGKSLSG